IPGPRVKSNAVSPGATVVADTYSGGGVWITPSTLYSTRVTALATEDNSATSNTVINILPSFIPTPPLSHVGARDTTCREYSARLHFNLWLDCLWTRPQTQDLRNTHRLRAGCRGGT